MKCVIVWNTFFTVKTTWRSRFRITSLPPKLFTRTRHDANNSLFFISTIKQLNQSTYTAWPRLLKYMAKKTHWQKSDGHVMTCKWFIGDYNLRRSTSEVFQWLCIVYCSLDTYLHLQHRNIFKTVTWYGWIEVKSVRIAQKNWGNN